MTFEVGHMNTIFAEALNASIEDLNNFRNELELELANLEDGNKLLNLNVDFYTGYIIGSIREKFINLAMRDEVPIEDIRNAMSYLESRIVSSIAVILTAVHKMLGSL